MALIRSPHVSRWLYIECSLEINTQRPNMEASQEDLKLLRKTADASASITWHMFFDVCEQA